VVIRHRFLELAAPCKLEIKTPWYLPIVIEIVESEQEIQAFLPILDEMIEGCLVTMAQVQALHYRDIKKE
jgi:PII-like signaling protein